MDSLDIEKIQLLIDLFKWLMGGFVFFLVFMARVLWKIHTDINAIKSNERLAAAEFKALKEDHRELKNFVYQKN